MTSSRRIQQNFFLVLLAATAVVMYFMLQPLLAPLALALSLGIVFMPMHRYILKKIGGYKGVASIISLIIVVLVVIIPLGIIMFLLFREAAALYVSLTANHSTMLDIASARFTSHLAEAVPGLSINFSSLVQDSLQWMVGNLGVFFSRFFSIGLDTFLLIITLFYFFKSGSNFRKVVSELSPLSDEHDAVIIDRLARAVTSVMRGSMMIAVIQGCIAGVGTAIFGLPNPVIWGVCAAVASLIPGIGTLVVMGPAIIYLFMFGNIGHGLGLLIWYICTLILVDNILSPYIIERGLKIHSLFILISVLGGIAVFGPIGFLFGPIILALFFALLDIYPVLISNRPVSEVSETFISSEK